MSYRNIIFDLDGTLIDSAELTGHIIDQMLAERSGPKSADRALIRSMGAVGGEAMIAAVMGAFTVNPAADLEEFRARHRSIEIPATLPFPGVRDTVRTLQELGTKMAICSNKPQFLCEKILGDLGMDRHFEVVFGSMPQRPRKPDPASAKLALAGLGAEPYDTLFCGDSIVDVNTANAAGMAVCLVSWGYGTSQALEMDRDLPVLHQIADLVEPAHGKIGLNHLPLMTNPRCQ